MNALFELSLYFGVFISLAAYGVGVWLKKMTGWSITVYPPQRGRRFAC